MEKKRSFWVSRLLHSRCKTPASWLRGWATCPQTAMCQGMKRHMTEAEEKRYRADIPRETIAEDRIWNKRPDGLAIKMPTPETVGEFAILEFKRISCVTDQYVSPICVHKIGNRTKTWPQRMVGGSEKLHSRSTISERAGPTRQPSLLQGPASRHWIH